MAKRTSISPELINRIRAEIDGEGHGERRLIADAWADRLGVSVATIYRKIKITNGKKRSSRDVVIPTELIVRIGQMKAQSFQRGRKGRMLRTDDCIRILEQSGDIEPGTVSRSAVDARLRKMGWNEKRVYHRHEPDHVNQVHMMDFSVSDYAAAVGRISADDYLIQFQGGGFSSYKNKPELGNVKLWLCSVMDTYSRVPIMQYRVSTGENLPMAASFMNYAYGREDNDLPVLYLPDRIEMDRGSIGKSKDFYKNLKDILDIEVRLNSSKSDRHAKHQAGGKIERQFESYWLTENFFSYLLSKKGINEISVSEMNALIRDECIDIAHKTHPTRRDQSRLQAYQTGIQKRTVLYNQAKVAKPNRVFEGDFYNILFKGIQRKADASGMISIDNMYYEIGDKRFVNERIEVIQDSYGEMMGECTDTLTGEIVRFPIWKFDPDNAKPVKPVKNLRQKLAELPDNTNYDNVSVRRYTAGNNCNIRQMPAAEKKHKAQTPFDAAESVRMMGYDDARQYITEVTGKAWPEIPASIQRLVKLAWENNELDEELLDDLAATLAS